MKPFHAAYAARLPAPADAALLTLALGPGFDAAAFRAWAAGNDFDAIGAVEMRLLPALNARLQAHGIDHPLLPRIAGIQRRAFYINNLLLHRAAELLVRLDAHGVAVLLLNAAASVLRAGPAAPAQPIRQIDLLLPDSADSIDVDRAVLADPTLQAFTRQRGYHVYRDEQGHFYRLHWMLRPYEAAERPGLLDRSPVVARPEGGVRVIGAEHQFFATVWAGMAYDGQAPAIWLADALASLGAADGFDWPLVVALADAHGCREMLAAVLAFLAGAGLATPGMDAAMVQLCARTDHWQDRWLARLRTQPPGGTFLRRTGRLVLPYLAEMRRRGELPGPRSFADHVRTRWGMPPSQSVVPVLGRKLVRRLGAARSTS